MRKWLFLAGAIGCEVTGSLSLKASLDHPAWYVLVGLGYTTSFVMLAATLRAGLPLGVAYGVWGALGVVLTASLAALLFDEALTPVMLAGMAFIIVGVLLVELGSHHGVST